MCGIAGIVNVGCRRTIDLALLERMSWRVRHRGPDDEGFVCVDGGAAHEYSSRGTVPELAARLPSVREAGEQRSGRVALAHRRYSVIDLSTGGHQPFLDHERRCVVVLNGEIYNYVELRSELEAAGHVFRTTSDTEVVAESFKEWGTTCFARLNGMWAIAIYDARRDAVVVSRDRVGKRPLYWAKLDDVVYFASEIKALLEVPEISAQRRIDDEAVRAFLRSGARDRFDRTTFAGVETFPAASWAVVDSSFPTNARTYWHLPTERLKEEDISVDEAAGEVRKILRSAVEIRLRADVPWALELSGGMDSSAIAAVAAEFSREPLVYTTRWSDPRWNEEPFARSVAARIGARHVVLDPAQGSIWKEILAFTYLQEEPYHSPNLHASQLLGRQMRADGIRVVLNGAAGDELFAGYGVHFGLGQAELLLRGHVLEVTRNWRRWSEASLLRGAVATTVEPARQMAVAALRRMRAATDGETQAARPLAEALALMARSPLTERLRVDFVNDLMPYWLRAGDKTLMGLPLEPRNPLLDYRMVDLAFALPVSYLIRDGWQKWIVRKAVENMLPRDVVWRRRKMGYPFPYERFFQASRHIEELIVPTVRPGGQPCPLKRAGELARWRRLSYLLWYQLFIARDLELFRRIQSMAAAADLESGHRESEGFTAEFLAQEP